MAVKQFLIYRLVHAQVLVNHARELALWIDVATLSVTATAATRVQDANSVHLDTSATH